MTRVKFEIKGLDRIKQIFNKVRVKMMDLSPVWPAIRNDFFSVEKARFDSQNKGRWRPLNEKYAAWKAKHYPGKTIMRATDNLYKSLTSDANESIYIPTNRMVTLGTSVKYALAQHFGTKERKGGKGQSRLPARPLISITQKEKKSFMKIMNQYIDTMIGKIR